MLFTALCRTLWKSHHVMQKAELSHDFSNSLTDWEEDENCSNNLSGSWVRGNYYVAMETVGLFLWITIWHLPMLFHQPTVGKYLGQIALQLKYNNFANSSTELWRCLLKASYNLFHWYFKAQVLRVHVCFIPKQTLDVTITWPERIRVEFKTKQKYLNNARMIKVCTGSDRETYMLTSVKCGPSSLLVTIGEWERESHCWK